VITYEDTGHVADTDAQSQDYGTVLKGMQEGSESQNAERKQAGFPAMHLVGWAQPPSYDAGNHSLIWARELDSRAIRSTGSTMTCGCWGAPACSASTCSPR
jgi:uncharacterized membrane-anchored protein